MYDSLDGVQSGQEKPRRNKVLGIDWALTVQFEMKCSLERKHNNKKRGNSRLLLFHQHNDIRYLWFCSSKSVTTF